MLKKFKTYNFESLAFSLFLGLLLWVPLFVKGSISPDKGSFVYEFFVNLLFPLKNQIITKVEIFFLFALFAFFTYKLFTKVEFSENESFLPVLIFYFFAAIPPTVLNPVFLLFPLLLLSLNLLLSLYDEHQNLTKSFSIGFLFGIQVLIYPKFIIFFLWYLLSLYFLRSSLTKEILSFLAGFLIVFVLTVEILFLVEDNWFQMIKSLWRLKITPVSIPPQILVKKIFWMFLFLFSYVKILVGSASFTIKKRTFFNIFNGLLIFGVLSVLLFNDLAIGLIIRLLAAIFLSYFFITAKETLLTKLLFASMILAGLAIEYSIFFN